MDQGESPKVFLERKVFDVIEKIGEGEDRVRELKRSIEEELRGRRRMIEEFRMAQKWHHELTGTYVDAEEPHEVIPEVLEYTKQHHASSTTSVRQRLHDYAVELNGESFTPKQAYEVLKERFPETHNTTLYNSLPRLMEKNILEKVADGRYRLQRQLVKHASPQDLGDPSSQAPETLDFSPRQGSGGGADD